MATNIKKKKVSELPEATNTTGFWIFGSKTVAGVVTSVKFAFDNIVSLFGVTQDKGQSVTLAPSQKLFTDEIDSKTNKGNYINASQIDGKYYNDKQAARDAVPAQFRGLGQIVAYGLGNGQAGDGGTNSTSFTKTQGYLIDSTTGAQYVNADCQVITINVQGLKSIAVRAHTTGGTNGSAFYDASGVYISGFYFPTSGSVSAGEFARKDIPANAVTLKATYRTDAGADSYGIPRWDFVILYSGIFTTADWIVELFTGGDVSGWSNEQNWRSVIVADEIINVSKTNSQAYDTKSSARDAVSQLLRSKYRTISYILKYIDSETGWSWSYAEYSLLAAGKSIFSTGNITDNPNYDLYTINVENALTLRVRCVRSNNGNGGAFFDASDNYISGYTFTDIEHGDIKEIPVPPNATTAKHGYPKDSYATSIGIPLFSDPESYSFNVELVKYKLIIEQFIGNNTSDWTSDGLWATVGSNEKQEPQPLEDNIIIRNREAEKAVMACRKKIDPASWENSDETSMPFFTHTSDVHSDATRFSSFIKYSEYLGVDAALVTGDLVTAVYTDDFSYYRQEMAKTNIKVLHVLGNHDNQGATTQTDEMQHARFFTGIDTKMGMVNEGKCYWHTDLSSKKIRIIGLNQYQQGGAIRSNRYFKTDQITWFINTLKSTPADYGVLLMIHQPSREWVKDNNYPKFWQSQRYFDFDMMITNITGDPIGDIIDAFIGKTTINKTYPQNGALTSLPVVGDFSTVNTGVEFIAHLNGHYHIDQIGYLQETAHKQLVLNVVAGQSKPGEWSDLPRKEGTVCEDAFNVYGIDRVNKVVRVARVGSNVNCFLEERNYMVIPYK